MNFHKNRLIHWIAVLAITMSALAPAVSQAVSLVKHGQGFAHTAITPTFNTNLTFQAPQTLALLPQLFYQSPKPLVVWVTPPSAAPPTQA
jgi:hypothetical protein